MGMGKQGAPSFKLQASAGIQCCCFPGPGLPRLPRPHCFQLLVLTAHKQGTQSSLAAASNSVPFRSRTGQVSAPACVHDTPSAVSQQANNRSSVASLILPLLSTTVRAVLLFPTQSTAEYVFTGINSWQFVPLGCDLKAARHIQLVLRRKWRKPSSWLRQLFQSAYSVQ